MASLSSLSSVVLGMDDLEADVKSLHVSAAEIAQEEMLGHYASLEALKDLAFKTANIEFVHGISEFTLDKMGKEKGGAGEFFRTYGKFTDEAGKLALGVVNIDGFLIDTRSELGHARSGNVLVGYKETLGDSEKEFFAFKPFTFIDAATQNRSETKEIGDLSTLGRYRGLVNIPEEKGVRYVVGSLIDGVTVAHIGRDLSDKIDGHGKYLIAYNLLKALIECQEKGIYQTDSNPENFMVNVQDLSVEVIDFGSTETASAFGYGKYPLGGLLERIFSYKEEKYAQGNFKNLISHATNPRCLEVNVSEMKTFLKEMFPNT